MYVDCRCRQNKLSGRDLRNTTTVEDLRRRPDWVAKQQVATPQCRREIIRGVRL